MKSVVNYLIDEYFFESSSDIKNMLGDDHKDFKKAFKDLADKVISKLDFSSGGIGKRITSKKFRLTYAKIFKEILKTKGGNIEEASDEFKKRAYEFIRDDIIKMYKHVDNRIVFSLPEMLNSTDSLDGFDANKNINTFEKLKKEIVEFLYEEKNIKSEISSSIESLEEGVDYIKLTDINNVELDFEFKKKKVNYQLFVPLNHNASKILASKQTGGCLGDWCTAYPNNKFHWSDIAIKGNKFLVYALSNTLCSFSKVNKIAIVFNPDKTVDSIFNQSNDTIINEDFNNKIQLKKIKESLSNSISTEEYRDIIGPEYLTFEEIKSEDDLLLEFVTLNKVYFINKLKLNESSENFEDSDLRDIYLSEWEELVLKKITTSEHEYVKKIYEIYNNYYRNSSVSVFNIMDIHKKSFRNSLSFKDLILLLSYKEEIIKLKEMMNSEKTVKNINDYLKVIGIIENDIDFNFIKRIISFIDLSKTSASYAEIVDILSTLRLKVEFYVFVIFFYFFNMSDEEFVDFCISSGDKIIPIESRAEG